MKILTLFAILIFILLLLAGVVAIIIFYRIAIEGLSTPGVLFDPEDYEAHLQEIEKHTQENGLIVFESEELESFLFNYRIRLYNAK